jgi:predicted O-methyltransferase YrrM
VTEPSAPTRDYVSPNLEQVWPDAAFPHMVVGDTAECGWPYLRREIAHNWYVDRRTPAIGFVSRDEAALLYNTALRMRGRPCLEIGCWRGWSTVHLALGGGELDCVDPILADPETRRELAATLARAGVADRVNLVPRRSPEGVEEIALRTGRRWSFAFIDGDHAGDAPLADAEVVQRFAADDAVVILHDLAAPEPAAALAYLREQGWETAIYQTMQILGVATRGACRPIPHTPDPAQRWSLPEHLASFPLVGERPDGTRSA